MRNLLVSLVTGIALTCGTGAVASVPDVTVTVGNASGMPASLVQPTWSLDIDGFDFESFTLDLVFDPGVLSFLPSLSTVSFNGASIPFTSLPNYTAGVAGYDGDGLWRQQFGALSYLPIPVGGPLLFTGVFKILDSAVPGTYQIIASGLVSTDPVYEERFFSGTASVGVVPEPDAWMLLLGGMGLVVWRTNRVLSKTARVAV